MQQHIAIFKKVVSACLFCPNENVLLISAVGSTVQNVVSACLFCPNENVLLISAVGSTVQP